MSARHNDQGSEHDTMSAISANRERLSTAPNPEADEGIAGYGITRVPVDYFHWREFRYTNLADAVAQAKRAQTDQSRAIDPETGDEMLRYEITRIPVDYFCYHEFRYTNANDAIAQARRRP